MCIYLGKGLNGYVRNQLPDGLWAYALMSAILIIWDRKPERFWIITVFVIAVMFESLQFLKWINGTADFWDIVSYFTFYVIALLLNKSFRHLHLQINNK